MNKPMCKLCGTAHGTGEPHQFAKASAEVVDRRHPSLSAKAAPDRVRATPGAPTYFPAGAPLLTPGCASCDDLRAKLAVYEAREAAAKEAARIRMQNRRGKK